MPAMTVIVQGLADHLGIPFDLADFERDEATLTTDHAAASYGQAVIVRDGRVYGPGDLPGVVVSLIGTDTAGLAEAALAAGWTVRGDS